MIIVDEHEAKSWFRLQEVVALATEMGATASPRESPGVSPHESPDDAGATVPIVLSASTKTPAPQRPNARDNRNEDSRKRLRTTHEAEEDEGNQIPDDSVDAFNDESPPPGELHDSHERASEPRVLSDGTLACFDLACDWKLNNAPTGTSAATAAADMSYYIKHAFLQHERLYAKPFTIHDDDNAPPQKFQNPGKEIPLQSLSGRVSRERV